MGKFKNDLYREIPDYSLDALDVDRINRNAKPLDKEEREIHKRLMPKQKTITIPISQLGNYINGGYYKKNSTGHLKDL